MGMLPVLLLSLTVFCPVLCSLDSYGTDFVIVFPENIAYYHPSAPINQVHITALYGTATVTLSMPSMFFFGVHEVKGGQKVVVNLTTYNWINSLELYRSNLTSNVLRVTSTSNITVQAVTQQLNSIQTMRILPTASLGKEYHIAMWQLSPQAASKSLFSVSDILSLFPTFSIPIQVSTVPLSPISTKSKTTAGTTVSDSDPTDSTLADTTVANTALAETTLDDTTLKGIGSFRLHVISTERMTEVNISSEEGGDIKTIVTLKPYQVYQMLVKISPVGLRVSANNAVAVLLSHPCAASGNCSCSLRSTYLNPSQAWGSNFLMPLFMADNEKNDTSLLVVTNQAIGLPGNKLSSTLKVDSTSPFSLILKTANMLLSLIPLQDFSTCFLLNPLPGNDNRALLVVPTEHTDGVHLGKLPLKASWSLMEGTDYSWALVELNAGADVIVLWHESSKMAVYYLGVQTSTYFGSPALSLSKYTDNEGCLLRPEVLAVKSEVGGWPESLNYCSNQGLRLITLNTGDLLNKVTKKLRAGSDEKKKVWMGLRRSSLTGEWYWVSGAAVEVTSWGPGGPGSPTEGQCAAMSLDDYTWSNEDCCTKLQPLCYLYPIYFPLS